MRRVISPSAAVRQLVSAAVRTAARAAPSASLIVWFPLRVPFQTVVVCLTGPFSRAWDGLLSLSPGIPSAQRHRGSRRALRKQKTGRSAGTGRHLADHHRFGRSTFKLDTLPKIHAVQTDCFPLRRIVPADSGKLWLNFARWIAAAESSSTRRKTAPFSRGCARGRDRTPARP